MLDLEEDSERDSERNIVRDRGRERKRRSRKIYILLKGAIQYMYIIHITCRDVPSFVIMLLIYNLNPL